MPALAVRCRIRPMQPGDIRQVMDIERHSFPTMWPQTVYQREMKNKMARYFVACEVPDEHAPPSPTSAPDRGLGGMVQRFFGGLPVNQPPELVLGMVGLWCMVGDGHIVTIAVRPEYRRRGLAELLLVTTLDAAREASQDVVTLEYRISNQAARALYDKYGFEKVGVRAGYYTDTQEDAVFMTTPPLRSSAFRRLLAQRVAELQARFGDAYPLPEFARHTHSVAPSA